MGMELRGQNASRGDFLSRFMDPSCDDLRPPLPQGFFLRTRDLLQPLEREEKGGRSDRARPGGKAPPAVIDINTPLTSAPPSAEHLLLGAEAARRVLVKPEWTACEPPTPTATAATAFVDAADAGVLAGRGTQQRRQREQRQWAGRSPSTGGGSGGGLPTSQGSRGRPAENKRGPMVTAARSNGGFADGEDDIFVKEEFSHKESTVNVDVGNTSDNNNDQKPSTPRSKHSATEQRRRTKINDRFQTLKDLVPPNDQKRDKASLLLEVIEYVQLLQDKVQKYESSSSSCPGRTQDGAKLTPWRARQDSAAGAADHSQSHHHPPPAAPVLPLGGAGAGAADPESGGVASQQQPLRWSPSGGNDEHAPPADEGLSNLSAMYSQGLLARLTRAMEGSGVDLTRASLAVRVNLGRRATTLPVGPTAEGPTEPPSARPGKRLKPEAS